MNSYEVWLDGYYYSEPGFRSRINAVTPGKAKAEYYRDLHDAGWEYPYTKIRCKKLGGPHTSEDFLRTARYRGVPFARCGMKVKVDGVTGIITGSNSSANFDVYFLEGEYKGLTLNCHPNSGMEYYLPDGEIASGRR